MNYLPSGNNLTLRSQPRPLPGDNDNSNNSSNNDNNSNNSNKYSCNNNALCTALH